MSALKIAIVGGHSGSSTGSRVGKTTLLSRYLHFSKSAEGTVSTMGIEVHSFPFPVVLSDRQTQRSPLKGDNKTKLDMFNNSFCLNGTTQSLFGTQ